MRRILLNILNAPLLVLFVMIALAIVMTLFAPRIVSFFQPDVIVIAIVWVTFRRDFIEAGILTLIFGNIAEIHSTSPQGVLMLSYMLVFLAGFGLSKILLIQHFSSYVVASIGAAMFAKILNLVLLRWIGVTGLNPFESLMIMLPSLPGQGLISWWAFKQLENFDWVTGKSPRARAMVEGELQLEEEGF